MIKNLLIDTEKIKEIKEINLDLIVLQKVMKVLCLMIHKKCKNYLK